jgi:hypothetical protein
MVIQEKRCVHCGIRYTYQASGYPREDYSHSSYYCKDCWKVIQDALSKILKKRERVCIKTNEVTRKQIEDWHKEDIINEEEIQKNNPQTLFLSFTAHRVSVPMFNLNNGDSSETIWAYGKDEFRGKVYSLTFWRKTDEYEIDVEMEKNLETGEIIGPWSYI